jgi:hypothetical protein
VRNRERRLLALWERAAGLGRWDRDTMLLTANGQANPPQALGARNAALLALRGALFGRAWSLISRCPACDAESAFEVDSLALADELDALAVQASSNVVDWEGQRIELRAPTLEDLRAVAGLRDAESAARQLVARCASAAVCLDGLDDQALSLFSARLECADPAAAVSFQVGCAACGHEWSAAIDVGEALWVELQRAAEQALIAIDALARTYGWTEGEVLRLSPTRRAAYLQLVGSS